MTGHPIPLYTKKNLLIAMRQLDRIQEEDIKQEFRAKIIERARKIDCMYIIPGNWNEDGTLK